MCSTETILGKIVEKIVDTVFQSVGRHVGFMLHYKQNLKNLDDVENNLQKLRSSVHEKVDEANHRGEAINNNVLYWLKDADETRQGVDNFRDEKAEMENMLCFNFISRYRLSKEAKDKVVHVKHVTEEGCKIENGTVSHPREAPPDPELEFPSSKDYEDFDSRDKVFKDIVKALKDPEVNRIGVYGTGGVGKTIMVRMVGKLVKEDGTFDQVAIADVSQNVNVRKIQAQLANYLNLTLRTEVGRASQLWNRLDNGKKNLIILDDVWQELDLMEIGIPITYGNKSCKVVLTARNRDVWKNMDVDKDFKIQILIEKESWALFQKKVGNYVDADQELREIAWAVCKECQGLPVAINAIGAALKNKDMYAWRDALDKLQNNMLNDIEGIDRQVYASLKWSYDRLDSEDAKSCFLLCCLFPEDARIPIDDLVRYYMAGKNIRRDKRPYALEIAFNRVHLAVGMLQRSCLLLDDENYNEDVVKMVDVVRDVAISIAKGEKYSFLVKHGFKDWPEKATYEQCSVISLRPHDMREFPDELACPALHTLRLDCTDNESRLQVPDRFFDGTKNLMVLDLKNVTMSPILPASLAKLAKLQTLCLEGCKLGDIAILKDLKDHLEILSLRCSNIEVLPPEVGELTRLRLLDMAGCNELEVIPKGVISKLFRLEELYMPQTFRQWEGTRADGSGRDISCVSFDELMSLTRLTTLYVCIRDPALLPENFILENLHVRFDTADGGKGYYYYSKDSTGVLQLENIHLANPLEIYPILYPSKSFSHLTKLSMTDCGWKIFFSPSLAKGLVALKRLEIKRCMDMEGEEDHEDIIPINFSRLTHLLVTDCRLKYIFSSSLARRLVGLKELKIERCMDMEGVIGKEGEEDHKDIIPIIFSRLDYLRLNNLPNLKSFYPKKEKKATSSESCSAHDAQTVLFTDKVILPVLEVLEVDRLGNIVEIWDKQSPSVNENTVSCGKLMDVKVQHCEKLTNLVPSNILPQLQNLQKLCVEGCPKIESVVFKNEKEGAAVDDSTMIIPQLQYLRISDMENLKSFYSSSTASNAQSLFNHQVSLPNLEVLHLSDLENLERLGHGPLSAGSLSKLKEFSVRCCGKLLCVFPSQFLPMLRELQELTIESCHSLDVVFQLEGLVPSNILPNLQKLCVEGCPEIESMVFKYEKEEEADQKKKRKEEASDHSSLIIPRLRYLRISGVEKLKTFYSSSTASNAHSLFNRQVTFPRLQNLELEGCASLRNIFHPYMVKVLENLGELIVNDCSKMESVIDKEEEVQDGQQRKTDKTLFHFHRLSKLELRRLPELRTFCHFTRPLELPLLNEMVICDCPSMDSFSLGHVSTPNLSLKGVSLYPEKRLRW